MFTNSEPGRHALPPVPGTTPGLTIDISPGADTGTVLVTLRGELDMAAESTLRDTVHAVARNGHLEAAVDLRGVTFCDAAGLKALRKADATFRAVGGRLAMHGPCPPLEALLDLVDAGFVIAPPLRG